VSAFLHRTSIAPYACAYKESATTPPNAMSPAVCCHCTNQLGALPAAANPVTLQLTHTMHAATTAAGGNSLLPASYTASSSTFGDTPMPAYLMHARNTVHVTHSLLPALAKPNHTTQRNQSPAVCCHCTNMQCHFSTPKVCN
jgi:hypothetical protein